jgi:hypothetical protein
MAFCRGVVVWGREQSEVERKESEPRQALYWGAAKEERRSRLRPMPKIAGSAVAGLARAGVAVLTRSLRSWAAGNRRNNIRAYAPASGSRRRGSLSSRISVLSFRWFNASYAFQMLRMLPACLLSDRCGSVDADSGKGPIHSSSSRSCNPSVTRHSLQVHSPLVFVRSSLLSPTLPFGRIPSSKKFDACALLGPLQA